MVRWLAVVFGISGCVSTSETVIATEEIWRVTAIDGRAFAATATFGISAADGVYSGMGPCNRYSGSVTAAPFPAVILSPPAATKRACPELAEEAALFDALGRVERLSAGGDRMTLFTLDGTQISLQRL